jgi:hypothetical protein
LLPQKTPENVAGAVYGLILGSSVIAAASAAHGRDPGIVEIYLCVTALVFYLAHVYARVIGSWVEGGTPTSKSVRLELQRESPMVGAQLLPAAVLLAGVLGLIPAATAITAALATALAEVLLAVLYAARKARATPLQTVISTLVAAAFALVVVLLKVFVHG